MHIWVLWYTFDIGSVGGICSDPYKVLFIFPSLYNLLLPLIYVYINISISILLNFGYSPNKIANHKKLFESLYFPHRCRFGGEENLRIKSLYIICLDTLCSSINPNMALLKSFSGYFSDINSEDETILWNKSSPRLNRTFRIWWNGICHITHTLLG